VVILAVVIAAAVPTLAILGAFWKLSGRLSFQDAMLSALRERVARIEKKQDADNLRGRRR
jgi:hypothetical protein